MGLVIVFLPGFILDILWYPLQIKKELIPQGFYFTSLFYFIWNGIFIYITYPFIFVNHPSMDRVQQFIIRYKLTERESDIISLLLKGSRNKDISKLLYIEESTVKRHIHHIFQKTGVTSRFALTQLITK